MSDKSEKSSRLSGLVMGGVLMGGAILAVVFLDLRPEPEEEEAAIRPLKTLVVESRVHTSDRAYPGRVRPTREVNLAFEVSGRVTKINVNKGDQVEQGKVLAELDASDYIDSLKSAQAEMDRSRAQLERVQKAAESNAVSQQDVTDAQAAFDRSSAQVSIREKAVKDTKLLATFPGLIANRFVEQFQDVRAQESILSLQDISILEIEVNLPEERIIRGREGRETLEFTASFEYLPGRNFPVELKELATEADPATQTYAARFTMEPPEPEDALILPGMTATIREVLPDRAGAGDDSISIPLDVAGIDGLGTYYVWVVTQESDGL